MQWILTKCSYNIINKKGDNNKRVCNVDMALMIIYAAISMFNAIKVWIPSDFLNFIGITSIGSVPTISVIVINIIVLIRLDISLYTKSNDTMKKELKKLSDKRGVAGDLIIETWNIRKKTIGAAYIVDGTVIGFCAIYGSYVQKSLVLIVAMTIFITLLNNFIDNAVIRYEAVPIVYKKVTG